MITKFTQWFTIRESQTREIDLIRAIHANPNDQQLWLVYADWLDDNGQFDKAALVRKSKGKAPSTRKGQTNYLGEREYQTFGAWRKAILTMFPGATFEGNKDIAQASFHGMGVGEWDGATGSIYTKFKAPNY